MREFPIIFSAAMVKAILEGNKTQTRRIVNPQPPFDCADDEVLVEYDGCMGYPAMVASWEGESEIHNVKFPYGVKGDILWVRENYLKPPFITEKMLRDGADTWPKFDYSASCSEVEIEQYKEWGWKHKPSIHMPKIACRIFLKIKSIRVEKLQEICESDAIAEGVNKSDIPNKFEHYSPELSFNKNDLELGYPYTHSAKASFRTLWKSIYGQNQWDVNPFVWVIEFEKL